MIKLLPHAPALFMVYALLVGMIVSSLTACKPDATPQAQDAEKWLIDFYNHYAIRGAWGVFGVEAHDDSVEVPINIPNQQAEDLEKLNQDDRIRFIAKNACPPPQEKVWRILETKGDVIIKARHKGNVFATVYCRINNKGNFP